MSDIIHLLPDSVANQIAAGEVIQRPASVLKELVENAVDAGATSIHVLIKDAGRTLIQVIDNGKGMSETDARMAFERHATSKIENAGDLFSIRTIGFRGEALASIAAVAQVELRTRTAEEDLGTLIEVGGSRLFRQEVVQCQQGTTFLIKNLFFNVPARRRFLKSDNVEKNHLLHEFYRIVLVHPDIEFSFFDGETEIFKLPHANIKVRIEQVFGTAKKKLNQQLLNIEANTNLINIKGFIGRPEFAQKHAHQYFFVNGRYMRHPYFHKAVMLAYNQLIQPTENPNYFIYFEINPQAIDINIHPTKTEIKFENEQAIWSILSATVKEALGKFNIVPSIDFDREGVPEIPVVKENATVKPPKTSFNPTYNPFGSSTYKRSQMDWEELYNGFESGSKVTLEQPELSDESNLPVQSRLSMDDTVASGFFQLKGKYIVTSVKSGMLMIHQRRAHVRILYDQFLKEMTQEKGFVQQLLFPESIQLMPDDRPFFEQIKPTLHDAGFEIIEEQTVGNYLVKGIPAQIKQAENIVSLLQEIIDKVKNSTGEAMAVMQEKIAMSLAESSAIHGPKALSNEEMSDLVQQLFACPTHNHTPDGKVIMTIWTQEDIQNRFR